jgi:hypothetical protein
VVCVWYAIVAYQLLASVVQYATPVPSDTEADTVVFELKAIEASG